MSVTVSFGDQLHGPRPDKNHEISGPCSHCPPLTPEQQTRFQEVCTLLKNIFADELNSSEKIKELKHKFSKENPDPCYLQLINVHEPSGDPTVQARGCDTFLHIAADNSHYEAIEILLNAGADPNSLNRWNQLPLHTVVDEGDGCHCSSCNERNAKCVELLLRKGSAIDVTDWQGDTPLACSAFALMDDCAAILWKHGASIHPGRVEKAGEAVASYIPQEVCKLMDDAIQQHEKERLKLQLDFGAVIGSVPDDVSKYPNRAKKETNFLLCMAKANHKAREMLLLHPLVQAYLHIKWKAVSILFTLLRVIYLIIALIYTCFIISFFVYNCPHEQAIEPEDGIRDEESCNPTPLIYTMSGFIILFVICMTLNECYEISLGLKEYLNNGLNYGWLCMIVTVTLNVLPVYVSFHGQWQYVIAAFGVFLAWGMGLTQLARHPKVGIYVEMLGRIVTEFLIFSITYFVLVVGFACGFTVLFPDNPMFEHIYGGLPFVKVLLMMIGETDYEGLFDEEENPRSSDLEYSVAAHIIFIGFIIIVTILLTNLLLGLAISDIQELKVKANLSRTERTIQQIDLLETLFQKNWVPDSLKSWYLSHFSIESQCDNEEFEEDENEHPICRRSSKTNYVCKTTVYKRIKGPMFQGFNPLQNTQKAFPGELKEQFIRFVNKDECSKKDNQNKKPNKFCANCEKLLKKMMPVLEKSLMEAK